jgi:hypothetical protein
MSLRRPYLQAPWGIPPMVLVSDDCKSRTREIWRKGTPRAGRMSGLTAGLRGWFMLKTALFSPAHQARFPLLVGSSIGKPVFGAQFKRRVASVGAGAKA